MNRRDFITKTCTACIAAGFLGGIISSCNTSRYIAGLLVKDGLVVDPANFRNGKKGGDHFHPYLVVRNSALKFPICLYRFSRTQYVALWMQCTHQGAELQVFGDSLQCPAHGSEFDNRGSVSSGPANRQLLNFPVIVQDDAQLFIDLRKKA
ncbi:ubiquinol-cytochrome c reductase iron-sulfur subunit [Hufsiella ginkgonis]|uniref:Rieske 2Fe-2S domain-containing protein n=1 Tax=Hufsiella ginkgonis TaxID=2695274 RepID=A0A7K1XYA3_9SPHI|nr:Rieske (2Fe-2S) protein [Hufsiella ginkgonis]MXV15923.1 Rieske 2Fe-2S domain-containing protein [Hufsiella ginkgonis]